MNEITNNDKYIIFRLPDNSKAGLDHLLAEFKGAVKEAVYWGRTLVIEKQLMPAKHNLGYELRNLEIGRYINIEKTQIYKIEENGSIRQINNLFRYVYAEDFNIDDYPEEQVLFTRGAIKVITKEQDKQYKVIIRETQNYDYPYFYLNLVVSFYPSDEVERLTDVVLKAMGASLVDVKRLSAVYQDIDFSANRDIFQQKALKTPLHYVCLHARGEDVKDTYQYYFENFRFSINRRNLNSIFKQMIPKDSRIYIMSDIREPYYFNFLKQDHTVYQYHDFLELKALVSGDNGEQIDNAMLYSVEKNIFQYAHIKMVRMNKEPKLIYTDAVYSLPMWYKLYEYYKYIKMKYTKTIRSYQKTIKVVLTKLNKFSPLKLK